MGFEHLDEILAIGYREMREPIAAWWAAQGSALAAAVDPAAERAAAI